MIVLCLFCFFLSDGLQSDNIQISPLQFVTNWSQTFNLTCLATDVYPLPEYLWKKIACVNGFTHSTCIFTPRSATDMIEAKCVVLNIDVFGDKLASKSVQLKFKSKYTFSVSFYNDF